MAGEKAILGTIPILHSAQLLSSLRKRKKKKLLGGFTDAVVGTSLIQSESQFINSAF